MADLAYETFLADQAHWDLLDEIADDEPHTVRAMIAQGRSSTMGIGTWTAREEAPGRDTRAPRPALPTGFPPVPRGSTATLADPASSWGQPARGFSDCHPGEVAARLIDGVKWCQRCLYPDLPA